MDGPKFLAFSGLQTHPVAKKEKPAKRGLPTTLGFHAGGLLTFSGDQKKRISRAAAVRVFDGETGRPVEGVRIRFEVLEGPLVLLPGSVTETDEKTDNKGRAFVPAKFTRRGTGLILAGISGRDDRSILFVGHSDGVSDSLHIYAPPSFPADAGTISARIVALDRNQIGVTGAELTFEAVFEDEAVVGEVAELGNGIYEGSFKTRKAGPWRLVATDPLTGAKGEAAVMIAPAEARKLVVIEKGDPRSAPPYDVAAVRVRLEDRFGNGIEPERIRGVVDAGSIDSSSVVGDHALFLIRHTGYGKVNAIFSLEGSALTTSCELWFAAAWLQDPGTIPVGSSVSTIVYALPPADRPARHAAIQIKFDPALVSFEGISRPPPGGIPLEVTHKAEGRLVTISVRSRQPVPAQDHSQGIAICRTKWKCKKKGKAWFSLVARMSPETPPWRLCMDQKVPMLKCLCINVVYRQNDTAARDAGHKAGEQVSTDVSDNVYRCCPYLRVSINDKPIPDVEWYRGVGLALKGNKVTSQATFDKLYDFLSKYFKPRCVNITMVPIDWGPRSGASIIGPAPGTDHGFAVIDPEKLNTIAHLGAHEILHTLGLRHSGMRGMSLMSELSPHGYALSEDECRQIWSLVGQYPC